MSGTRGPVPGPGILDIAPYVGGDAKLDGVERPIRLASNESALGPSPKAIAAYRALAGEIHRYPDGSADELRRALGERHGLDPAQIVCGAGSDELIGLLLRAYAGPGYRGALQPSRLPDVSDRRDGGRRDPGRGARARPDRRCRRDPGARDAKDAHRLHRQPQQPDRHLSVGERDGAAARRPAA